MSGRLMQAAKEHQREQVLRKHWVAWLDLVNLQARARKHHTHNLLQAGFTALFNNAASAQHQR